MLRASKGRVNYAEREEKLLRSRSTKRTTLLSIAVRASTAPESRPWAQRVTGHPQYAGHPHNRWTSRTAHVRAPREGRDTASAVEAQSTEPASRTRPDDRHDSRSSSARLAVVIRTVRRVYDRGTSRTSFTVSERNILQPELRKKKTIVRLETSLTILKKTVNSRRCGDPRSEILPPRCGYAAPFAVCLLAARKL